MTTRSKVDQLYARVQELARVWNNSNQILQGIADPETAQRFSYQVGYQRNELRLAANELIGILEDYFLRESEDGVPIDLTLRSLYKKLKEATSNG